MKLLLIEDNKELLQDIKLFLSDNQFIVETAQSLEESFYKIGIYYYELIILDLGLPDGNGLEVIKKINQGNINSGILIVTAKDSLEDKIEGLELGADDYITKPFHNGELLARIKSIIRRKNFDGNNIIKVNDIVVDLNASEVKVNHQLLQLTKKEYDLLLFLVFNKNRVLTKESIAEHLWGDHIDNANNFDFVYNHLKNVRKKIAEANGENSIKSVYGMGYKLVEL